MTREVFILDYVRTPFGRFGGKLADIRPDDLAAATLRALADRGPFATEDVSEVVLGCANQAGEDNRNVARMAGLLAGIPVSVPAITVNRLCASGLDAVNYAYRAAALGEGDLFIAGGVESMTRAPWVMPKPRGPNPRGSVEVADTALGWRLVNDAMPSQHTISLGETAENVANRHRVSRERQDQFALRSHQLAIRRRDWLAEEIASPGDPVEDDGLELHDDGPREQTSLDALSRLPPAFVSDGSVTAGNASPLNDGAAALTIAATSEPGSLSRPPLARIVTTASAALEPAYMGLGPVPASRLALERPGLTIDDVDVVEINEAFASQVLASLDLLGVPEEKVNLAGGAIAIGHPLGASGARLIGTLARQLHATRGRFGLATMCVGVGQGVATLIERV